MSALGHKPTTASPATGTDSNSLLSESEIASCPPHSGQHAEGGNRPGKEWTIVSQSPSIPGSQRAQHGERPQEVPTWGCFFCRCGFKNDERGQRHCLSRLMERGYLLQRHRSLNKG